MMRSLLSLGLGCLCLLILVSPASAQTDIDDIQVYDDTGAPNSPFAGMAVTIQGVLTVFRGTYNFGTHYVQDATGGMSIFDGSSPAGLNPGDEVSVTGSVSSFSGEIQLGTSAWTFIGSPGEPVPAVLTVAQTLDNDNSGTQNAADYEIIGSMVSVTGNVSFVNSVATFRLYDGADSLEVFIDSTTGIDISGVQEGDPYTIVSPVVNFNGLIELKPRKQADLISDDPVITDVLPSPYTPETSQSVDVSATITDNGSITSATLFYRDVGAGGFSSVAMGNVGDTYSATIPGTTASGLEYYIEATDDGANTATLPGDAPTSTLALAVGTTSIVTIQSTLGPGGSSALSGTLVNVEGVVTAPPGEFSTSLSQFIIEEPTGGHWSGLFVFEGSGSQVLFRGDKVRISGTVNEFAGTTQVVPQAAEAVELISFGEPMPPVLGFTSTVLDTSESLENVLVRTLSATVCDTLNGGADWFLMTAGADSCVRVDPGPNVTTIVSVGEPMFVQGILDGRFGAFELQPRDDEDVMTFPTAVGPEDRIKAELAVLGEIHPNPFNPSTTIKFSIPRDGMTDLAIYNTRGQLVKVLARGEMEAGDHERRWTGLDDRGHAVASGVYYARLRFMKDAPSVRKLTLMK